MTFKKDVIVRPPLASSPHRRHALMLAWEEFGLRIPKSKTQSRRIALNAECFAKGWTGLKVRSISPFELKVMQKIKRRNPDIKLFRNHSDILANVSDNFILLNEYELWCKRNDDALRLHQLFQSFPSRDHVAVSRLPIEPVVLSMLEGQNYHYRTCTNGDGDLTKRAVISVQDFDQLGTMMAILKLTM